MKLHMALGRDSYDITLDRGALEQAGRLFSLRRRVLIVTDDGVPAAYARTIAAQCAFPVVETLPQGEKTKQLPAFRRLLERMLSQGFTRSDCVVAVGGGVVGDLAGFCAACYMRGIDFYNVPTTVLSQVDSSIGGKTAIDMDGYKNVVGAFHQPRGVLIDPQVLETLSPRQRANGLAESVKMALTSDAALFRLFETADIEANIDEIIFRSLEVKRQVVQADEREQGLRRILNFGHTLGHGLESAAEGALYHGECVALGMLPMCDASLRPRVEAVLRKLALPTRLSFDEAAVLRAMKHDKKGTENGVLVTLVSSPGVYRSAVMSYEELLLRLRTLKEDDR